MVNCHAEALPSDVAPAFGKRFLTRYYESTNQQISSALFVAEKNGLFGGFVLVSTKKQSMTSALDARALATFVSNFLRNIKLPFLLVRQLFRFEPFPDEQTAEIAFIAVDDEHRGQGIGKALIHRAGEYARSQEMPFLATKTANEGLARFYQQELSAEIVDSFSILGRHYSILRWPV